MHMPLLCAGFCTANGGIVVVVVVNALFILFLSISVEIFCHCSVRFANRDALGHCLLVGPHFICVHLVHMSIAQLHPTQNIKIYIHCCARWSVLCPATFVRNANFEL